MAVRCERILKLMDCKCWSEQRKAVVVRTGRPNIRIKMNSDYFIMMRTAYTVHSIPSIVHTVLFNWPNTPSTNAFSCCLVSNGAISRRCCCYRRRRTRILQFVHGFFFSLLLLLALLWAAAAVLGAITHQETRCHYDEMALIQIPHVFTFACVTTIACPPSLADNDRVDDSYLYFPSEWVSTRRAKHKRIIFILFAERVGVAVGFGLILKLCCFCC